MKLGASWANPNPTLSTEPARAGNLVNAEQFGQCGGCWGRWRRDSTSSDKSRWRKISQRNLLSGGRLGGALESSNGGKQ